MEIGVLEAEAFSIHLDLRGHLGAQFSELLVESSFFRTGVCRKVIARVDPELTLVVAHHGGSSLALLIVGLERSRLVLEEGIQPLSMNMGRHIGSGPSMESGWRLRVFVEDTMKSSLVVPEGSVTSCIELPPDVHVVHEGELIVALHQAVEGWQMF
jgi:hypothetical protein